MRIVKSFENALRGLAQMVRTEKNFQIHIVALVFVTSAGFYFDINKVEWIAIMLISAMVLSAEAINSSIEKLSNHLHPEEHNAIKKVKDIAAGAVLVLAIFAIIIGLTIFVPYMK
ncbi:MAG: diacylglycerol kinase family protein [Crocinitomicaceae bacterium]